MNEFEDHSEDVCFCLKRVGKHLKVLTESDVTTFPFEIVMLSMWINDQMGLAWMQVD